MNHDGSDFNGGIYVVNISLLSVDSRCAGVTLNSVGMDNINMMIGATHRFAFKDPGDSSGLDNMNMCGTRSFEVV